MRSVGVYLFLQSVVTLVQRDNPERKLMSVPNFVVLQLFIVQMSTLQFCWWKRTCCPSNHLSLQEIIRQFFFILETGKKAFETIKLSKVLQLGLK